MDGHEEVANQAIEHVISLLDVLSTFSKDDLDEFSIEAIREAEDFIQE